MKKCWILFEKDSYSDLYPEGTPIGVFTSLDRCESFKKEKIMLNKLDGIEWFIEESNLYLF